MAEWVQFQSTLWSRMQLVRRHDTKAVSEFVERYRDPVFRFIRNAGFAEPDAEELTQDVFARLLAEDVLAKAESEKGKFRSFLLGVARNVIREERRRRAAEKRGGDQAPVSLDRETAAEPAAPEPPDEAFDRDWMRNLLGSALESLERGAQEVPHPVAVERLVRRLGRGRLRRRLPIQRDGRLVPSALLRGAPPPLLADHVSGHAQEERAELPLFALRLREHVLGEEPREDVLGQLLRVGLREAGVPDETEDGIAVALDELGDRLGIVAPHELHPRPQRTLELHPLGHAGRIVRRGLGIASRIKNQGMASP